MTAAAPAPAPRANLASLRAGALLRCVADQLEPQAEAIAGRMVRAYEREIPGYGDLADAALRADVQAVSAAMVRTWLTVMATGRPASAELLRPLTEGARRRVVQGIDLESMLRAYRIGIRVMWSELVAAPAWRGSAPHGLMGQVATWALDFADRITTAVAGAYADEAAHVAREREHRRSGLLSVVLAGAGEQRRGPDELGRPHRVVVVSLPADLPLAELEAVGCTLEDEAGALLWTVRHCSVVAAVPAAPGGAAALRARLATLGTGPRCIGIGGPAEGAAETRHSYAEATDAAQFGPRLAPAPDGVYDYRELAAVVALVADPVRARRFVATALEPLAPVLTRRWAVPTVQAYLACQGRLKEVAAVLGIHHNTVKYRLAELRPLLDEIAADGDGAATLLLALRVQHYLAEGNG